MNALKWYWLVVMIVLGSCKQPISKDVKVDVADSTNHKKHMGCDEKAFNTQVEASLSLDSVSLNLCGLDSIPSSIHLLKDVQSLQLFFPESRVNELNMRFEEFASLKTLILSKSQISSLPEDIRYLKSLETLEIYGGQLKTLPTAIGELSNLKKLVIWRNQLQTIPINALKNTKLQTLHLIENNIRVEERIKIKQAFPNCDIKFDY